MNQRKLGKTNRMVSEIGLVPGNWVLSGAIHLMRQKL